MNHFSNSVDTEQIQIQCFPNIDNLMIKKFEMQKQDIVNIYLTY